LLKGRYIYIDNDDQPSSTDLLKYNAIYLIKDVYLQENRTYRLNLGDSSVIRGWKDANDYSKGYVRDFSLGASFRIPL
jgi:hypothetical protein